MHVRQSSVHITIFFVGVLAIAYSQNTPLFPVACELNVLIVVDRSDSVKGGFNKSRRFVTDVSEELQIGPHKHRVAMVVYSGLNYRREVFPWNFAKNNEEFVRITNNLRAIGGTTNTKKALEVAIELLGQRNITIPTLVMVVTDGRSADDPKEPAEVIQRMQNLWMFAAATGDPEKVDKRELLDITGNINHIVLHRGRELATDITKRLLRQAQGSLFAIEKCRTTTTSTTTTTTTTMTTTTTTNPITGCELDLVLVIDFSTTTEPLIRFYKEMSERLVKALRISPHHTRVAVVTFATVGRTRARFNLKRYKTQDEILAAIRVLESTGGTTAIGEGIKQGIQQYTEREGGRPGIAKKVMVVFTDGWSNKGPDPEQMAKEAVSQGIEIYSASYTAAPALNTKRDLVSDTEGVEAPVKGAVTINDYTLEAVAQDVQHIFTDKNFDRMIDMIRQRNLKCL